MVLEDELREHLRTAEGLREYRLFRSLGSENRFFRAEFWRSQTEADAFWRSEERREFMARLTGVSTRGVAKLRRYEVLHQLGDAGMVPSPQER